MIKAHQEKVEPDIIRKMRTEEFGENVHIGSEHFVSEDDSSIRIRYHDALDRLIQIGYVKTEGEYIYRLTREGMERARKLIGK